MGEIRKVAKVWELSDSVGDLVPVGFTEVSRRTSDILHKDGGFDVERWDKLTWRNGARFVAWQDGETYEGKYTTLKQKVRVPKALATWKRWTTSYASECQFLLVKHLSTKRNRSTCRVHPTGTKLQESGSKALKEKSSRRRMNSKKLNESKASTWNCHWLTDCSSEIRIENRRCPSPYRPYWTSRRASVVSRRVLWRWQRSQSRWWIWRICNEHAPGSAHNRNAMETRRYEK